MSFIYFQNGRGFLNRGPSRVNSDKQHDPTTERKMKSRQEATFLNQIAAVTAKPRISDKE